MQISSYLFKAFELVEIELELLRLCLIHQHVELGVGGACATLGLHVRAIVRRQVEAHDEVAARYIQALLKYSRRHNEIEIPVAKLA